MRVRRSPTACARHCTAWRARFRSVLGPIGIALVSTGENATAEARRQFEALGTDIVTVETAQGHRRPGNQLDEALALVGSLADLSAAAPTVVGAGGFVHAGRRVGSGVTWGICDHTGGKFFVSALSIAVGPGVSSAAGLLFGLQPAFQASRLHPIVALQAGMR